MKPLLAGIGFLMLSGLITFAGASENPGDIPRMMQMNMSAMCPATLPGVQVSAVDTANGIAVTFSAATANLPDLQKRVEHLANMPMANRMFAADVNYEALENGARLTFKPKDPATLEELRKRIRTFAEQMKKGDCTMMETMNKMDKMDKMDHMMPADHK